MKVGKVTLIGRPNVGKSTLLNNILGQKISITSPRPQTTRFPIRGVYQDKRGQIIFIDTPGIFRKIEDRVSLRINPIGRREAEMADLLLYVVDHTRMPKEEERKILGIVRRIEKPKILVINKIDIQKPSYIHFYQPFAEECQETVRISALKGTHIKTLLAVIYQFLPEGQPLVDLSSLPSPALNLDAKTFIAEIIREKAFLATRQEVPYSLAVEVKEMREDDVFYIKALILTLASRYKRILVGKKGQMIKKIGTQARKELELISGKKVYLDLEVVVDRHWPERLI